MKKHEIRALADETYSALNDPQSEAVVEHALRVLMNAPNDPESFLLMSEVAEENDLFDHALMWIDSGLEKNPTHEGLLFKKASLLIDGFEDIEEAFSILKNIKINFENKSLTTLKSEIGSQLLLDIHLLLTDCYRLKGDLNEAMSHATISYEIAPSDENAILAFATAHFELGDYEKAEALLEPIDQRSEASDFHWLKGQVLCAKGQYKDADQSFSEAFKLDKSRHHRPIRLAPAGFQNAFEQALMALPREIRELIQNTQVHINEVVPQELVIASKGALSPLACITIETIEESAGAKAKVIALFQKNIENLATKKEEVKDLIASALLHELEKIALNN